MLASGWKFEVLPVSIPHLNPSLISKIIQMSLTFEFWHWNIHTASMRISYPLTDIGSKKFVFLRKELTSTFMIKCIFISSLNARSTEESSIWKKSKQPSMTKSTPTRHVATCKNRRACDCQIILIYWTWAIENKRKKNTRLPNALGYK